jgi:hypothetical protein
MTKPPKRPRDTNQLAKFLVDRASGEAPKDKPKSRRAEGGKVGGKARAAALSKEERGAIARKGAAARWNHKKTT